MEAKEQFYSGFMERKHGFVPQPDGDAIRPSDGIELAIAIARAEKLRGGPIKLADLSLFDQEMCERFSMWCPGERYGTLAVMLVDECKRLVSN